MADLDQDEYEEFLGEVEGDIECERMTLQDERDQQKG